MMQGSATEAALPSRTTFIKAEHLAYLDGWRGLAILCVLVEHFIGVPGMRDFGRLGVDLFFVLSGLLMSRILFEQRMPIGKFYRRRTSRILPAFLLFVGVSFVIFDRTSGKELAGILTFTRTYMQPPIWGEHGSVFGHLWSLNVEEHCYLLLALIAAVGFVRGPWLLVLSALTLVAVRLHMHFSHDPQATYLLNTECAATGLLASAGYRALAARWQAPPWASTICVGAAALCYLARAPWWATVAVSPFLLAFAVNQIGWLKRPLEARWLGTLGLISYSVYLWQQPFYRYQLPLHLGLVAALASGAASFYFFESPIRRWLNENWGKQP